MCKDLFHLRCYFYRLFCILPIFTVIILHVMNFRNDSGFIHIWQDYSERMAGHKDFRMSVTVFI